MENLVSIIIPVHNGEKYLEETILSILDQTYHNFELIIVNDRSTDQSVAIAKKYCQQDDRVKLIHNTLEGKLPGTLNTGFKEAKGHYLTWISDDNLMSPEMIYEFVKILDNQPDIGLVTASYTNIDENSYELQNIDLNTEQSPLVKNNFGICFLYRKDVAIQVGQYNTDLFLIEDYEYFLRLLTVTNRFHIHKYLGKNRVHRNSLSAKNQKMIRIKDAHLKRSYLKKNMGTVTRLDYFQITGKIILYHDNYGIKLLHFIKCILVCPDYIIKKILYKIKNSFK